MFENIELSPNEYFEKVEELKNDGFEMMVDLTAIDWFRKKEPRFEIVVNFLSVSKNKRVCLVVKVNDDLNVPRSQASIQVLTFTKEKYLICLVSILKIILI